MKRIANIILCITLVSVFGCQKGPYPYISKAQLEKISNTAHPAVTNAAFVFKGNVYYVPDFTKAPTQITTDGSAIGPVRMSHDHSRFAYQTNSSIQIVNNKGASIATLTQYQQAKSFDWSPDDKTLYILNNSVMYYYGPTMHLPDFTYPGIDGGVPTDIMSASVSMNGDFAYVVHSFDYFNGDQYELVVAPANNGKVFTYTNDDNVGQTMDYVSFSGSNQDMVLGWGDPNGNGHIQISLDLFSGLKTYPDMSYPGSHSSTPAYNSTLNYLIAGYADPNNNNEVEPAALYLGHGSDFVEEAIPQNLLLSKYASTAGTVYTDLK